jgi:hypothetical protein
MSSPPRGGPATVNGILYQILWSLLRALKMHVRECDRSSADNSVERAVLVLEPREGGGDVQERSGRRRVVEQLKAKSGGGTWSLTDLVKEVLPDLYLARDPAAAWWAWQRKQGYPTPRPRSFTAKPCSPCKRQSKSLGSFEKRTGC